MAEKDLYIASLEKKLAELSGIEIDQIRKNQLASAADEARSIKEMAEYVEGITVQKAAVASQPGVANAQISALFDHITAELGETAGSHSLPPLKYEYKALEPHISGLIMEIHHTKHHQGYINNLKTAAAKLKEAQAAGDQSAVNSLFPALKFNGGGHINHTIFWTNMAPNPTAEEPRPSGELLKAIEKDFGSFEKFQTEFSSASGAVKGSGWGWLGYNQTADKLSVATCQNQDPLQLTHGLVPLLGLDVWEHAYYLQYKNLRPDYIKAFFKVINWENVAQRYQNARKNN